MGTLVIVTDWLGEMQVVPLHMRTTKQEQVLYSHYRRETPASHRQQVTR